MRVKVQKARLGVRRAPGTPHEPQVYLVGFKEIPVPEGAVASHALALGWFGLVPISQAARLAAAAMEEDWEGAVAYLAPPEKAALQEHLQQGGALSSFPGAIQLYVRSDPVTQTG